jgi:hypothetical protein
MANEIKLTFQANVVNGGYRHPFTPGTVSIDQSAQGVNRDVVTVNTSAYSAVPSGSIGTPGLFST